jgi:CubicO group peptidase (beta-lactamase class C family)
MAEEEGKLTMNQTIDAYFPSIPNASRITIQQLLYHRSGIRNFVEIRDYQQWKEQPQTEAEMVERIARAGSDFRPDSKSSASSSKFTLLSYILEKTYKKPYSKLIEEKITKPAKLNNTYVGKKINTKKGECNSYKWVDNDWAKQPETDLSIPMGAGSIVSTSEDLIKFSDALFNGDLIPLSSVEKMKEVDDLYGQGLFTMPFYYKVGYGRPGSINGFSAIFANFDDVNVSLAITSNGMSYSIGNITAIVLSIIYKKPFEIPPLTTYAHSTKELEQYTGEYFNKQIPLKMTITKEKRTLIAQGEGQSPFTLEGTAKGRFKSEMAGAVIDFMTVEKEEVMIVRQKGEIYIFPKVK